jgi:integrase
MTENFAASIKASTAVGYGKAISAAISYSRDKRTLSWDEPALVTITQVIEDMIDREDLTQSTKNMARAALLWYIRSGQVEDKEGAAIGIAMLEKMQKPPGRKPLINRPKKITEEDLEILLAELDRRSLKSEWAKRCAAWVSAGLVTGVRPIEWLHSEWVNDEHTCLRIKNAKIKLLPPAFLRKHATEEETRELERIRSLEIEEDEPSRIIPIDNASDISIVEKHLHLLHEFVPGTMSEKGKLAEFKKYHDACALLLRRTCRKLWGTKKAFTLYTMRKQFSANMKAVHGSDITAELMGHSSSDSPSAAFYGKANQAHARFKGQKRSYREILIQSPSNKVRSRPTN